ncbi:hypothetical protein [uncultured Pelagimonas sp.]|uniref:hypothetical protein n=1 Tax=uncultured Pelagimonas sp. TaxID=1618102 RepID=UPI00261CE0B8|nr:hypothetical protein [uncultured Pelagimonas sp.]
MAFLRSIKNRFGAKNRTTSQLTDINGNGNNVDQSVNNNTYIFVDPNASADLQDVAKNPARPVLKRALNASTLAQAARNNEDPVVVFLAGPYIKPESESESKNSAASKLRFELFHRLKDQDFDVSLGTYPNLVTSFAAGTGEFHNAADAELTHARDVASLVVMIPDSPGSFAEIGAFSLKREICRKMIILADATHEKNLGYLNTGPVACAQAFGSKVERVDYKDVEGCIEIVSAFSNRVKTQIQLQSRIEA